MKISKRIKHQLEVAERIAKSYYAGCDLSREYVSAVEETAKHENIDYSSVADVMTRNAGSGCNKSGIISDFSDFFNGNPTPLRNRFEDSCNRASNRIHQNDMYAIKKFFAQYRFFAQHTV